MFALSVCVAHIMRIDRALMDMMDLPRGPSIPTCVFDGSPRFKFPVELMKEPGSAIGYKFVLNRPRHSGKVLKQRHLGLLTVVQGPYAVYCC